MFDVGKRYQFRVIEDGDETMFWATVQAYEHPLITVGDDRESTLRIEDGEGNLISEMTGKGTRQQIINVTSPNFISATPQID